MSDFSHDVSRAFDLGASIGEMTPVTGGLTHRMWRLATDRGVFAVKDLDIEPGGPWTHERIEGSFLLEQAALDIGAPMPRPVVNVVTGGCLAEIEDAGRATTVRVHEWIEGEGLRRIVYGADFAGRVGGVIARVHGLAMPGSIAQAAALWVPEPAHWEHLAERVERSDAPWKWEFRAILHTIAEIEAYVGSARSDDTALIMGHRDADQKNWMKTPAGDLLLVDWDAAGPVNPRHEVASLALTWAGVHLGEPDWKVVRAWIRGYRDAGGEIDVVRETDLAEFVSVLSRWFEFNVRRAIREQTVDEGERKLATDIVRRGFKDLPRYVRSLERWTRLLADE